MDDKFTPTGERYMLLIHTAVSNKSLLKTSSLSTTLSISFISNSTSGFVYISLMMKAVFFALPKGTITLLPNFASSSIFSGTE